MIAKKYLLIDSFELQTMLQNSGYYKGKVDGKIGPQTLAAAKAMFPGKGWNDGRALVAAQQTFLKVLHFYTGAIDGLVGPDTRFAIEKWQDDTRDKEPPAALQLAQPNVFPRQADVHLVFGAPGENIAPMKLPYKMKLAWNTRQTITTMQLNKKVHDSAGAALEEIRKTYGADISKLRLDLFGGSFAVRLMRGGKSLSMHSYGIAIDFDPERNQLRWGADKASLDNSVYAEFWRAWESRGWVSLGRARNFDWMHVQAARL